MNGIFRADVKSGPGTIPLDGMKVEITGQDGKVLTVTTDKEGQFELTKLKAGKYSVEAFLPPNFTADETVREVEIVDRGCSSVWLEAEMTGKITGRMTDVAGRPYNSSFLHVSQVSDPKFFSLVYGHSIDESGNFLAEGLPPGTYYLFMDIHAAGDYHNDKRYYYPGTYKLAEAKKVEVGLNGLVDGLKFILPPEFRIRTIKGRVTWPDGRPAAKAKVFLLCPQSEKKNGFVIEFSPTSTEADEQGDFEIQGFAGEVYWLLAEAEMQIAGQKYPSQISSPSKKIILKDDISGLKVALTGETGDRCGGN